MSELTSFPSLQSEAVMNGNQDEASLPDMVRAIYLYGAALALAEDAVAAKERFGLLLTSDS